MTLEELLRSAAREVADRAPDGYVAPSGIRARAAQVRRRQRVGIAAGLVCATAVAVVGLQALVGGSEDAQEPIQPAPSPTAGATTAPGVPVVEVFEITDDDLGEYEVLGTMTNAQAGNEGLTDLRFEVAMRNKYGYRVDTFCSGDPDTWLVYLVGKDGAQGHNRCDGQVPQQFPTFDTFATQVISLPGQFDAPATKPVRMFVTRPTTQQQFDCLYQGSPVDCQDITPGPLASTDVTFGISVYEYRAPSVAQVLGWDIAALAPVDGTDYVLSQVLTPGADQSSFTTTLPAGGDRIVTVLERSTDAGKACVGRPEPGQDFDEDKLDECSALELRIGDRTVPLEGDEFGDIDALVGQPPGFFRVPAGDQEVELRLASGDPENVEFALVLFEERS